MLFSKFKQVKDLGNHMHTHQAVLLNESISGLAIKPDGIYLDGTFGRGGHSRAILAALGESGRLIAIDKDLEAVAFANAHFSDDQRFSIFHGSFTLISDLVKTLAISGRISGILLDLGVSSPQINNPERGFSFMHDGPLDMRMDQTQHLDASQFINSASVDDMADVFKRFGEERFALRIARALVAARAKSPIHTTARLADLVKAANPSWERHKHPATRVFQAIRIFINSELSDLTISLKSSFNELDLGGRLVVIAFHSLEDRMVKQFMKDQEQGPVFPLSVPIKASEMTKTFRRIGRAIKPKPEEIKSNPRARSAVLRIGEKIA